MAKKKSSKVTKEQLAEQNAAISEQLDGLQTEVEMLDEEVGILIDENDELEAKNDALQDVIVSAKASYQELEAVAEAKESLLKFADVIIDFSNKLVTVQQNRIKELEQENFHLSIQRDALKDRVKTLEARTPVDVKVLPRSCLYQFNS